MTVTAAPGSGNHQSYCTCSKSPHAGPMFCIAETAFGLQSLGFGFKPQPCCTLQKAWCGERQLRQERSTREQYGWRHSSKLACASFTLLETAFEELPAISLTALSRSATSQIFRRPAFVPISWSPGGAEMVTIANLPMVSMSSDPIPHPRQKSRRRNNRKLSNLARAHKWPRPRRSCKLPSLQSTC